MNEKYVIKMSRSGLSLLVGWLTESFGGEAMGTGAGFTGEQGKRGRVAVMAVVNNHLSFQGICTLLRTMSLVSLNHNSYLHKSHCYFTECLGGVDWSALVSNPAERWKHHYQLDQSSSFQRKQRRTEIGTSTSPRGPANRD